VQRAEFGFLGQIVVEARPRRVIKAAVEIKEGVGALAFERVETGEIVFGFGGARGFGAEDFAAPRQSVEHQGYRVRVTLFFFEDEAQSVLGDEGVLLVRAEYAALCVQCLPTNSLGLGNLFS
jgi:hypothetical protein